MHIPPYSLISNKSLSPDTTKLQFPSIAQLMNLSSSLSLDTVTLLEMLTNSTTSSSIE
jgi:hypothetical protein